LATLDYKAFESLDCTIKDGRMKVIFVEQDRCLACRNCERVCSFQEAGGFKRENTSIWVRVDMDRRAFFTLTCQQCETAACLNVCPPRALQRDPLTNAVIVDESLCVGCRMCVIACPFGCIQFEEKRHTVTKCNLCNGEPKCVQNCMAGALHYAEINMLAGIKRKKVDQRRVKGSNAPGGEKR
jgi:Fe-S-cluster-containing hydrogenase component 2